MSQIKVRPLTEIQMRANGFPLDEGPKYTSQMAGLAEQMYFDGLSWSIIPGSDRYSINGYTWLAKWLKEVDSDERIAESPKKGKCGMFDTMKKYWYKHEDTLFPIIVILLLDHFVNDGGLRKRVVAMMSNLLDRLLGKLETKELPPASSKGE